MCNFASDVPAGVHVHDYRRTGEREGGRGREGGGGREGEGGRGREGGGGREGEGGRGREGVGETGEKEKKEERGIRAKKD